jgi:hypothetical protein
VLAFPSIAMWFPNWLDARRKAQQSQQIEKPLPDKAVLLEDGRRIVVR